MLARLCLAPYVEAIVEEMRCMVWVIKPKHRRHAPAVGRRPALLNCRRRQPQARLSTRRSRSACRMGAAEPSGAPQGAGTAQTFPVPSPFDQAASAAAPMQPMQPPPVMQPPQPQQPQGFYAGQPPPAAAPPGAYPMPPPGACRIAGDRQRRQLGYCSCRRRLRPCATVARFCPFTFTAIPPLPATISYPQAPPWCSCSRHHCPASPSARPRCALGCCCRLRTIHPHRSGPPSVSTLLLPVHPGQRRTALRATARCCALPAPLLANRLLARCPLLCS